MNRSVNETKALSVAQLVRRMKNVLQTEVGEVWVEGEASNLRKQASGHWYFSLKDASAQISCAMFSARHRPGSAALKDGDRVRVLGEVTLYEARGQAQLVVKRVESAGLGDLQARFEALKRKLEAEGLFERGRKQAVPEFSKIIGIVTSPTGAAIRDIHSVLERRAPWVTAVLAPVRVQGKGAEREIAAAIRRFSEPDRHSIPRCDVLIVGRGGGSLEDLWNFNEEIVARAIAECPIPVISAVGHEIDFTIADFVADLRAPTPSAAAELAVPDQAELRERFSVLRRRIKRRAAERIGRLELTLESFRRGVLGRDGEPLLREPAMRIDNLRSAMTARCRERFADHAARLRELELRHRTHHPQRQIDRRTESVGALARRFRTTAEAQLDRRAERLRRAAGLLQTLGPESAFRRGFSITMTAEGKIVRSPADTAPGELLRTRVAEGELRSRVE
jgi:exodeoxyribonuclease VII large subunit